jgi:ATP-dependent Clp protease adaptor protein ClpS
MATHKSDKSRQGKGQVAVRDRTKLRRPPKYKVFLHNDDYTTMEFVVDVLTQFFDKGRTDATRIMLHIHHHGLGLAGLYPHEIAETKVAQVTDYALTHEHPLKVTMEKD